MRKLLLAALAVAVAGASWAASPARGPKVGAKAPRFVCPLLNSDEAVSLKDQMAKGNVVLLSFFHTTCKPCIREIPELTKIIKSKEGKALSSYLVFVGTEDDAAVNSFMKEHGFVLPVLKDRYGLRIGESYGVVENEMAHVPQIYLISKNGIIKAKYSGSQTEAALAELPGLIDTLLAEEKEVPSTAGNLTILFTNNTNGMLLPAPGIGVGGLARRATVVKRERAAGTVLLLDGGDFMPTSPDAAKTKKVVSAMAAMKYDAVAIGEAEFVNGLKYLRSVAAAGTLPLMSSNVKLCKNEECSDMVRGSKVIDTGKRKVGIFAYTDADAFGFTPEERMKDGPWYIKMVDWKSPLKAFLEARRKEIDLMVVISHAGVEMDRQLAEEFPDIDVIIGAHSQTFMNQPMRSGKTVIVQAAGDGQYVGKLVMKWEDNGKPAIEGYELVPLTKAVTADAEVDAVVTGKGTVGKEGNPGAEAGAQ